MTPMLSTDRLGVLRANAQVYARQGAVSAIQLPVDLSWTGAYGVPLLARAGDWLCTDGQNVWSVVDEAFTRNYVQVGAMWHRVGFVQAVQVEEECLVPTLEGPALALPGDWICWYAHDMECPCWPVVNESFASVVVPAD